MDMPSVDDWDEEYERLRGGRSAPGGSRGGARGGASSSSSSSRRPGTSGPSRDTDIAMMRVDNDDQRDPGDGDDNLLLADPVAADTPEGQQRHRQRLYEEDEPTGTPLETLTMHWMNERNCPDILPAQEELLTRLLDHLRRQSEAVQLLRGDPMMSEDEHLRIMLVQTEIERVKFIVRSYVRTRLFKIEKYARFITVNGDVQTRLTAAERAHASRHAKLTDQHMWLSILQSLPENQAHLDESPMFVPPMVTQPEKTKPVFAHALQECPRVQLPDGRTLDMPKGHISLVPYDVVEHLVMRGEVELI